MARQKKGTRITVSLPENDHAELTALANQCDVSLSWTIRQAIADFLKRHRTGELQLPLDLSNKTSQFND